MINFEAVIRHVWKQALDRQLNEFHAVDQRARTALQDTSAADRAEVIQRWLKSYQVFQGFAGERRLAIAKGILKWADSRNLDRDLTSIDDIVAKHAELKRACAQAYGQERDFTSLASKALWLCYPNSAPIFDSFVQRALWIISKLDGNLGPPPDSEADEYRQFVHVWMQLYHRCADTLHGLDLAGYPYRVRIFDKILWLVGAPRYGFRLPISRADAEKREEQSLLAKLF